jgi:KipI family sensor histidine kinase inhibitor
MLEPNSANPFGQNETNKDFDQHSYLEQVAQNSLVIRIKSSSTLSLKQSNEHIKNCLHCILSDSPLWLRDYIIAYDSLLIVFDESILNFRQVRSYLYRLSTNHQIHDETKTSKGKVHTIEVCYSMFSDSHPNDLPLVASATGLNEKEIVALHQSQEYQVFAIGFMPNFAYLGELHDSLKVSRLSQPRLKVPAGAVAITGKQTAVYPSPTPGGWHIIAYTAYDFTNDGVF